MNTPSSKYLYGRTSTFGTSLNAASERAREPQSPRLCVECGTLYWTTDPSAVRCAKCSDEPDGDEVPA